jgi:hypothetical protein
MFLSAFYFSGHRTAYSTHKGAFPVHRAGTYSRQVMHCARPSLERLFCSCPSRRGQTIAISLSERLLLRATWPFSSFLCIFFLSRQSTSCIQLALLAVYQPCLLELKILPFICPRRSFELFNGTSAENKRLQERTELIGRSIVTLFWFWRWMLLEEWCLLGCYAVWLL